MNQESKDNKETILIGVGIALGAGIGAALGAGIGAATGNMGFWSGIGVAFGVTVGIIIGAGLGGRAVRRAGDRPGRRIRGRAGAPDRPEQPSSTRALGPRLSPRHQ